MNAPESIGPPPVKNPKHRLLADYFLRDGSKTQAAIDSGYSVRSASTQGAEILARPDVAAYIAWMQSSSSTKTLDIREQIDEELRDIAFANIEDLTRVNADGELVPYFGAATRKQMKAVTSVSSKVSTRYDKDGNVIGKEQSSRFGFIDKVRSVELLGKLHGLFNTADLKVTVDVADRLVQARARLSSLPSDSGQD